eukprot:CAMPEP_0178944972 /NCGR_PEP_ID=MMETSP0789-20121207/3467_1 /TAXON_ID=3005 /ORGANISM="Rhizosolenia setigera, Strain CCMP 1694" /LENGTH=218 /DNA_ID=CAMNT_0020624793 /DNA_START=1709 /DNA_END=2365 /DNA_ORIENTATION=-
MSSSDEESHDSGAENESVDEGSVEEEEESVEEKPKPKKRGKGKKKKDPAKPKRNMSAFFIYSNANRARIKEENPDAGFGDIAKLISAEFKQLDGTERAKWDKKAAKDKIRYEEEMKDYVPPDDSDSDSDGGGKRKKKKSKKVKDPNKPKRNMSAYFLYSVATRPQVKQDYPDLAFGDIAKKIAEQFRELDPAEKSKWDKKAAADKERYQREMAVYNGN